MNRRRIAWCLAGVLLAGGMAVSAPTFLLTQIPTTLEDFFQPGSQPSPELYGEFVSSTNCSVCHEFDVDVDLQIYSQWQGSMMAHSARDPLFYACLAIANQDAAFAGDICLRCHTPAGWISGRSEPTDGSALIFSDRDGVSCSVCHRMVDPVFDPETSPAIDATILAAIEPLPVNPGGGNFIFDPEDRRRGPFADVAPPGHSWLHSPFHKTSEVCATCHDVSNPVYERQSDGTYVLTLLDEPHPTADKYDMFPLERTYSEWLNSEFAATGVDMGGRFGGNITVVSTCQDCHMPDITGEGCSHPNAEPRDDLPSHQFAGGNAWVQDMVLNLYPDDDLIPEYLEAGKERSRSMLERAATLEADQHGYFLNVRVTNETGHKLPSGYPEGRRMWLNVQQFDGDGVLIDEFGYYEDLTAELTTADTKVYEAHLGVDASVSQLTGIPAGKSFHFALNNIIVKDNRIPPRGFSNAKFETVQAAPVAAVYDDGQYWDDTEYRLLPDAAEVTVNLYYQTASKEYITFLRDENVTNDAGNILYGQWELTGMSPPVLMGSASVELDPFPDGDFNDDGQVDLSDYASFLDCFTGPGGSLTGPCEVFDFDADLDIDFRDFAALQFLTAP